MIKVKGGGETKVTRTNFEKEGRGFPRDLLELSPKRCGGVCQEREGKGCAPFPMAGQVVQGGKGRRR